MTTAVGLATAAIGGAAFGWWLARRPTGRDDLGKARDSDVGPQLLPDPALDWLRRAHGALGVWVAELDSAEGAPGRSGWSMRSG